MTETDLHDLGAEKSILSCIMQEGSDAYDEAIHCGLNEEAFFSPEYRLVFAAASACITNSQQCSILLVHDEIKKRGQLELVGGMTAIETVCDVYVTLAHVQSHAQSVVRYARLRGVKELGASMATETDATSDLRETIGEIDSKLLELSGAVEPPTNAADMRESIREQWDVTLGHADSTLPSRFYKANELRLYSPGLIVLAARPSQGKSTLMLNDALYQAERGFKVGIASIEMSTETCYRRMACEKADVSMFKLDSRHGTAEEIDAAIEAMKYVQGLPIYITDFRHTPSTLSSWARRTKRGRGLDILWVDYLQLMASDMKHTSGNERVQDLSGSLVQLRKQLRIPVVALSQLSRANEKDGVKPRKPRLSDLRDSGAIEQDADTVLMLHSQGKDDPNTEAEVEKNRNGPLGRIDLVKEFGRQRFKDPMMD